MPPISPQDVERWAKEYLQVLRDRFVPIESREPLKLSERSLEREPTPDRGPPPTAAGPSVHSQARPRDGVTGPTEVSASATDPRRGSAAGGSGGIRPDAEPSQGSRMPPDSAAPNRPSEVEIQRIEEIARRLNLREFANNLQSRIPAEELLQFLSEVEKVCSHEHGRGRGGSGGEGSREPGGGPEDAAIRLSEQFYNLCYRNRVAKNHTHDAAIALCDELNRRLWEPGVKPLAAVQRGIFDVSRHQSKSGSEQLGGHDKIRPLTFLFRPQESGSQPRLPIVERDPNASEGGSA